jgi:hypothetical protein
MWLWLDVFLVLLNGNVLVGVAAFDSVCVCVSGVAMREEWAGLLLPGGQRRKDR